MNRNAKTVLKYLIDLFKEYLTELSDVCDCPETQFEYGEKTAYVECLEIIAMWNQAEKYGLNFDVEKKFPLM